jgi:hypothetical protein
VVETLALNTFPNVQKNLLPRVIKDSHTSLFSKGIKTPRLPELVPYTKRLLDPCEREHFFKEVISSPL